ncbi:MAG: hypothetical protein IKN72_02805 [Clostridia bacterium]|nr:hypothetical protein [Clostridia bacterium]
METILYYVIEFFFYSAAGWLVECIYRSIGERRLINTGFLTGPMCPIYGTAALFLTVLLYNNFRDRPLLIFLLGMVLCDVVEFVTSWLMEKLFHARWWDYTYEFLNIQGRICIKHTLYWGIISIAFVMVLHPAVDSLLHRLPARYYGVVVAVIMAVFLLDVANAVRKAADIRSLQDKLHGLTESLTGTLASVKAAVENRGDRVSDSINNRLEQAQDFLTQFELRFSTRGDKKDRFTRRIFRNNFSIAQATRKRVEKLKAIRDEIRVVLREDDELQ